jgi:hypothetical protein
MKGDAFEEKKGSDKQIHYLESSQDGEGLHQTSALPL